MSQSMQNRSNVIRTNWEDDQTRAKAADRAKKVRAVQPMMLITSGPAGQGVAGEALLALGDGKTNCQNESR